MQAHFAMLQARSPSDFERNPEGGFVAGDSWFYFAVGESLFGYVIWGRPETMDIQSLVRLLELELARPPHSALVHLGDLEFVSPEAFQALADYTVKYAAELARSVTHTAIVRPEGVNGAIVTGFFDVSSRPFPVSFWESCESAFAHLGRSDASECAEALQAVRTSVSNQSSLLRNLRAYILANLAQPSIAAASSEVGLAIRTLQRRLSGERTSFENEVRIARMETAMRRLRETDSPITSLALDLGFSTPQHFSTLFRTHTGMTPSDFRARKM